MNRPLVSVVVRAKRASHAARVLRRAALEQLGALGLSGRELSLALVADAEIRRLNRDWRGKDQATDVLSFPQGGRRGPVGDVVISLDTARRQARAGGWPLSDELRRLLAHGLLHCVGHDHEAPRDARRMARAEELLLGRAGMVGESLAQARAR